MKKISIILTLLTINLTVAFGQSSSDSITMKKVFGGYQFYQGGTRLNMNQLVKTMQLNEQAYQEIKSAKSTYIFASIVGGIGGFMVGWPVGTALGGGEPNWAMAGIGAGLIVVSIPISQQFNKQSKKAVDTFNNGLKTASFWDKNELKLAFTGNGAGLVLKF